MIGLFREEQDLWRLVTPGVETEITAEGIRSLRVVLRNAPRMPIPPPPDPPPVVVEVPVLPEPPDALALAISGLGVPAVLATLFTGMTAAQVQQLVKGYLPGGRP